MFKNEKSFLGKTEKYLKSKNSKLKFKKVDAYQLSKIKRDIKKSSIKDDRKTTLILLLLILVTAFSVLFLINNSIENTKKEEIIKKELYFKNNINQFNYLIESGDVWLKKEKYYNAIFQYKLALKIFPENKIAIEKLTNTYSFRCLAENIDCDKN